MDMMKTVVKSVQEMSEKMSNADKAEIYFQTLAEKSDDMIFAGYKITTPTFSADAGPMTAPVGNAEATGFYVFSQTGSMLCVKDITGDTDNFDPNVLNIFEHGIRISVHDPAEKIPAFCDKAGIPVLRINSIGFVSSNDDSVSTDGSDVEDSPNGDPDVGDVSSECTVEDSEMNSWDLDLTIPEAPIMPPGFSASDADKHSPCRLLCCVQDSELYGGVLEAAVEDRDIDSAAVDWALQMHTCSDTSGCESFDSLPDAEHIISCESDSSPVEQEDFDYFESDDDECSSSSSSTQERFQAIQSSGSYDSLMIDDFEDDDELPTKITMHCEPLSNYSDSDWDDIGEAPRWPPGFHAADAESDSSDASLYEEFDSSGDSGRKSSTRPVAGIGLGLADTAKVKLEVLQSGDRIAEPSALHEDPHADGGTSVNKQLSKMAPADKGGGALPSDGNGTRSASAGSSTRPTLGGAPSHRMRGRSSYRNLCDCFCRSEAHRERLNETTRLNAESSPAASSVPRRGRLPSRWPPEGSCSGHGEIRPAITKSKQVLGKGRRLRPKPPLVRPRPHEIFCNDSTPPESVLFERSISQRMALSGVVQDCDDSGRIDIAGLGGRADSTASSDFFGSESFRDSLLEFEEDQVRLVWHVPKRFASWALGKMDRWSSCFPLRSQQSPR